MTNDLLNHLIELITIGNFYVFFAKVQFQFDERNKVEKFFSQVAQRYG